jgi:LysR family transcriptional regulator, glycine cleavage system transcriptional activator
MRRLPPLNALRAFEAAARHATFSGAARELCVTHGAVSKQIDGLEARLGVVLFHRAPRGVTLTDAGRAYMHDVGEALDRIAAATARLAAGHHPQSLRISAPPTFTIRWLVSRLSRFQLRHPALEIRLGTRRNHGPDALHDADIAIRRGPSDAPGIRSVPFLKEAITPVCHPSLASRASLRRPADLRARTWLYVEARPDDWPTWLAAVGSRSTRPVSSLRFDHTSLALEAAADAMGVAMGPLSMVRADIEANLLVAPFADSVVTTDAYYLLHACGREAESKIAAFCDWLVTEGQDFRDRARVDRPAIDKVRRTPLPSR